MKIFKGAKGKWKVVKPDHIGCTNVQFGDDIFNGFIEIWHHQSSKEEALANAHLIATAPELLEALIAMIDIVDSTNGLTGWHMNGDVAYWEEFRDVDIARDVINKALGL